MMQNQDKFNRRKFLMIAGATAGTALVGHQIWQRFNWPQNLGFNQSNAANSDKIIVSKNGLLEVDLEASYQEINLDGQTAYLLTYNRQLPGPRLEAKPGDKVRINFINHLSKPTNVHYHGLHIPPTGKGDNVFLQINPKEKITYEFEISQNQTSGLAWYHPHLHGLTAEQLSGGLAGLFIIRGELDEIPEIKAAKEEFLVLQDFALDEEGKLFPSEQMPLMMGREGNIITLNGQVNPVFSLPQNGLLRLRILNASTSRFYRLALENHPLHLIATDGNALESPLQLDELLLTPGQRADVLIKGNKNQGNYALLNLPYNRGAMGMMGGMRGGMMGGMRGGMRGGMMGNNYDNNEPMVLATLNYSSAVEPQELPQQLIPITALSDPQNLRQFSLNHGMFPGMGMAFLINGEAYEQNRIQTQVELDTIEDWELINTGVMDHPFHIHVNKFQVISRNGIPEPYRSWHDTVLVRRGETVRIRIPFRDFTGKTVYHCHILDHEDLGMMGNLVIKST